jgi:DNA-directed RNA polymerase specialized sigma24 family protein
MEPSVQQPGTIRGADVPVAMLGPQDHHDPQQHLERALRSGDPQRVITVCWQLWRRDLLQRILAKGVPVDHADDVLQNVFALLARDFERVRSRRLRGWLFTIVGYECRRFFQERARARPRSAPLEPLPPPDFGHNRRPGSGTTLADGIVGGLGST